MLPDACSIVATRPRLEGKGLLARLVGSLRYRAKAKQGSWTAGPSAQKPEYHPCVLRPQLRIS
jgi:hypothetical protein